jgi:ubiquinone/menaquinone biosynthesis C-methylase UbiE
MRNRRAALILGDGDGRFTAQLLKQNPRIEVDAVDASDAMLRQLVRRTGSNAGRVRSHLADVRDLDPPRRKFDLVATHFLLDCLTSAEIELLAARIRESITDDAVWVVSEFAIPDNWYGRLIAKPLVTALYFAFGFLTGLAIRQLPAHREALQRAGFMMTRQRQWLWGLLVSELWQPGPFVKSAPTFFCANIEDAHQLKPADQRTTLRRLYCSSVS